MSDEDWELIKKAAKLERMSQTAWIEKHLLPAAKKVVEKDGLVPQS